MILASYFTYQKDPQGLFSFIREYDYWPKEVKGLMPLIDGCVALNIPITIFHNGIEDTFKTSLVRFIEVPGSDVYIPYVYRWRVYLEYLLLAKHEKVFMVDSTDVEVLKNPFDYIIPNRLYIGSEADKTVNDEWMQREQSLIQIPDYTDVVTPYNDKMLPNAGIVGGCYEIIIDFLYKIQDIHEKYSQSLIEGVDMVQFNYILWKYFSERFEYGDHINTGFKKYEYTEAWFKHK